MTKVRQALDFATPSQDIIDKLSRVARCRASPIRLPAPGPTIRTIQPRPYDLEQAKALLAEAGLTPRRRRRPGRPGADR